MPLTQNQKQLGIGLLASGAVAFVAWALARTSSNISAPTQVDGGGEQTSPATSAIGVPVSSPSDDITNYDPFSYAGPSYPSTNYGVPPIQGGFVGYLTGNAPNNGSNWTLGAPQPAIPSHKDDGCGCGGGCGGGASSGSGCNGCAQSTQLAPSITSQVGAAPSGFFQGQLNQITTFFVKNANVPGGGYYSTGGSPYDGDTTIGA